MIIRQIRKSDQSWIENLFIQKWASTKIVTRGRIHQAEELPGFIAWQKDQRLGLITYRIENKECEVISLNSLKPGLGIGKTLLSAVIKEARKQHCSRIWLITTNDNLNAQEFYEHLGWKLVKIHKKAINKSRKLKPEIPLLGCDDIPIKDEYEYQIKFY
jgi:N-acetylglutamate synthase-like GNAT family acetyltransferase